MWIGEKILESLSKRPDEVETVTAGYEDTIDGALSLLDRVYPDFGRLVTGKLVVDFGCGVGWQSIALAKDFRCRVVGIDSNSATLSRAKANAAEFGVASDRLLFADRIPPEIRNAAGLVISQNSFEHFPSPAETLAEMASLLAPSGVLLITFGPPWYAPYGSHMHFFCRLPWLNLIFLEKTVMKVRGKFRSDGATRYEDVESGLNKMSLAKFERIIASSGFELTSKKYECVKGLNWLGIVPLIRELFVNHITVTLVRGASKSLDEVRLSQVGKVPSLAD